MKKIGLMGAMNDEILPLYHHMQNPRETVIGGVTFYEGILDGKEAVLCCAGMGKAQAAAATQILCSQFGVQAILFSGIAGNMTAQVQVGDIVIGQTIVYHDGEPKMFAQTAPFLEEFQADDTLVSCAKKACEEIGISYLVGKIATGDCFIGDSQTKQKIADAYAPHCVEMEGAAVAHIAAKNNVPFVILRAMSDNADEEGFEKLVGKPFDISEYCTTAAKISRALISAL